MKDLIARWKAEAVAHVVNTPSTIAKEQARRLLGALAVIEMVQDEKERFGVRVEAILVGADKA